MATIQDTIWDSIRFKLTFDKGPFTFGTVSSISFGPTRNQTEVFNNVGRSRGFTVGNQSYGQFTFDISLSEWDNFFSAAFNRDDFALTDNVTGTMNGSFSGEKDGVVKSWTFSGMLISNYTVTNDFGAESEARVSVTAGVREITQRS